MVKILHIVGLAHGGVGRHMSSLLEGCDSRRFDSTVAMAVDTSSLRPRFEQLGVRVVPLDLDHYGGPRSNARAFKQLATLLRNERFDVIQTHTSVAGAIGRLAAKMFTRTPVVHMIHAFAGHPYRSPLVRKVATFIERRLDRYTDFYIVGSRAMLDRGVSQKIFTADKVELISNSVDLAQFDEPGADDPMPPTANEGRTVTVGFLGRLEEQKGAVYLIRAAAKVLAHNRAVRFVIAGDGRLREPLESLARKLGVAEAVTFLGWRRDSAALLKQIDILAMPSLWEAFGLSAAEAMAAGKPVVASSVEGLPEVVEDGRTGILVSPADDDALARAILDLSVDPARRRAMGIAGRARVERLFSLDQMIARNEQLYQRLADAGRVVPATEPMRAPHDPEFSMAE
jgi:glycosyltransferase involved in cell wall biosynthesis